jgi:hypothetical protein
LKKRTGLFFFGASVLINDQCWLIYIFRNDFYSFRYMKKVFVIAAAIIIGGCNPILKTSFWGLRLSKSYTPEEIISAIGTEGAGKSPLN